MLYDGAATGLNRRIFLGCAIFVGGTSLLPRTATAQGNQRFITVVSTHSTQDSGLLSQILPLFTANTGIGVRVVALGTGQALDAGRRGDGDVVLSHFRSEELRFVTEGFGVSRQAVMYNDFVLVGPKNDPAGLGGEADLAKALARIRTRETLFISRGDRSGTHATELTLWPLAGIDIARAKGAWYREIGQGMGAALNMAAALGAYTLTDRGTWLNFRNRADLTIVVEGAPALRNQYGVILVNPTRHPHVKAQDGQRFIAWLIGPEGQKAIADYRIAGEQLFFANAAEPGA